MTRIAQQVVLGAIAIVIAGGAADALGIVHLLTEDMAYRLVALPAAIIVASTMFRRTAPSV